MLGLEAFRLRPWSDSLPVISIGPRICHALLVSVHSQGVGRQLLDPALAPDQIRRAFIIGECWRVIGDPTRISLCLARDRATFTRRQSYHHQHGFHDPDTALDLKQFPNPPMIIAAHERDDNAGLITTLEFIHRIDLELVLRHPRRLLTKQADLRPAMNMSPL